MVHPSFRNVGAYVKGLRTCSAQALAAGTGDATETNGPVVDRMVSGAMANSAVFMLAAVATLAAGKKCTLKATFQHDTDSAGGTMADVAAALQPEGAADSVVLTLTDGGAGGRLPMASEKAAPRALTPPDAVSAAGRRTPTSVTTLTGAADRSFSR